MITNAAAGYDNTPKDFKNGDRVIIHSFGDGKEHKATVRGRIEWNIAYSYFVEPDNMSEVRKDYPYSVLLVVESCLQELKEIE